MLMRDVIIGGVPLGDSHPVRIAAEIGTYFGTDMEQAKEYVDFAKKLDVDFLKTEILHDLNIIHDNRMVHAYQTDDGEKVENYLDLLERKLVSLEAYRKLIEYSREQGLPVIASIYDFAGVDFLVETGAAAAKIASQNITNRPLIEHCAKSGLPLVMDAGNALLYEVAEAVDWAEKAGVNGIVINHRPDGSPCPPEKHNLRLLESYHSTFGWPVGLACHHPSDEMIYASIGLGAKFIEKPVYHKRAHDDQDTAFVLYYDDFEIMVNKVRNCSAALGDGVRHEQIAVQMENRACLVANRDLQPGDRLDLDAVRFAWPMVGISAARWPEVEGMLADIAITEGTPILWGDIRSES